MSEELQNVVNDAVADPAPTVSVEQENDQASADLADGHDDQPKVSKGVQKRLDELTREKYEERRRAQRLEDMLAANQRLIEGLVKPEAKPQQAGPQAPDPSDYVSGRFDPDYIEALADYKASVAVDRIMTAKEQEKRQAEAETQRQSQAKTIAASEKKASASFPDYVEAREFLLADSVLADNPVIGSAVSESDDPAAMIYYLGKHPDEAYAIATMSPYKASKALAAIESKLAPKATEEQIVEPSKSRAPAPISPIGGSASVAVGPTDLAKARSMEEYARMRRAQMVK